MEAGVWQLITARQDRLETRVEDIEDKIEGVPELRKSVDRLTVAVLSAAGIIAATGAGVVFFGPG